MSVFPYHALHRGYHTNLVFFDSGCLWMVVSGIGGTAQIDGLAFLSVNRAERNTGNDGVRQDPVFFRTDIDTPRWAMEEFSDWAMGEFSDAVDWFYGGYFGDPRGYEYGVKNGLIDVTDYYVRDCPIDDTDYLESSSYRPFLLSGVLFDKQRSLVEVDGGRGEWQCLMGLYKSFYLSLKMGWTGVHEYGDDGLSPWGDYYGLRSPRTEIPRIRRRRPGAGGVEVAEFAKWEFTPAVPAPVVRR